MLWIIRVVLFVSLTLISCIKLATFFIIQVHLLPRLRRIFFSRQTLVYRRCILMLEFSILKSYGNEEFSCWIHCFANTPHLSWSFFGELKAGFLMFLSCYLTNPKLRYSDIVKDQSRLKYHQLRFCFFWFGKSTS